jgi:hypothetical protein
LAAIQGLYSLAQEQAAQIATQQERIDALEQAAGVGDSSSDGLASSTAPVGWLALGGLAMGGVVLLWRRRTGGEQ